MGLLSDLTQEVEQIFRTKWEKRDGQQVPEAEDIKLGNDAVILDGTVLYADLAESTSLVMKQSAELAAEAYKTYLVCASRLIRDNGGVITAFDGDRVMGVYIGSNKNTAAAKTALQINYAVLKIINPKLKEVYPQSDFVLRQAVGIDTSKLFVARTGIRGANDLVWVGRAANLAAKLCSLREGDYTSFITKDVFDVLNESSKLGGNPKRSMWEERLWTAQNMTVYRSNWHWQPSN